MAQILGVGRRKARSTPAPNFNVVDEVLNLDGTHNSWGYVGPLGIPNTEEEIVYTCRSKTDKTSANFCRHKYQSTLCPGVTVSAGHLVAENKNFRYESPTGFGPATSPLALSALDAVAGASGFSILGAGAQGYINDAFYRLKPDLTTLSVPNFLLELDDLPRMFQLWSSKLSWLRNLAAAKLNVSFGWAPFLADVRSMAGVLRSVYQQCLDWNKREGQLLKKKYTFPPVVVESSGSFGYSTGNVQWDGLIRGRLQAFMVFRIKRIPALDETKTILKAYLDALGFQLDAGIIWEAIPFSFVLDWFYDVGHFVSRFRTDTLELPVVLETSYLQYYEEATVRNNWVGTNTNFQPVLKSGQCGTYRKIFHRVPIFPDLSTATATGWKIPNLNQLVNAISLGTVLKKS